LIQENVEICGLQVPPSKTLINYSDCFGIGFDLVCRDASKEKMCQECVNKLTMIADQRESLNTESITVLEK
jgi:hypothetical protein